MTGTVQKYSYRDILRVAWPILVSLVMEQMIGLCDTAFLGRVNEIDLGASAIAGVFYTTIFMLGLGFSFGSQVIIGRRNGEGDLGRIGSVFYHGIYFLGTLAIVVIAITEIFCPRIMGLMISSPEVLAAGVSYVRWRMPGLLFAFCTVMFRSFFIGTTRTRTLTLNSIVMVLSNVFFNWVLIFGKFGLPALGITGAAIGSSLAELVSLIFFIIYTLSLKDKRKYNLHRPPRIDWKELGDMLRISIWTMIDGIVVMSTWMLFFIFIEHYSEHDLAVSNLLRSISGLLWMIVEAFASTATTMVSNMIGEDRSDEVLSLTSRILKLAYLVVGAMLLIPLCFPQAVVRIFTDIPMLVADTAPIVYIVALGYLVTIPGSILWNVTMGTGNVKTTFALEMIALVAYVGYCVIAMRILVLPLSLCWLADYVYFAALAIIYAIYLRSGRWKGKAL